MPLNIFDGSSWNPLKKIQIHDGSSWNESKAAYVWTGSEWKSLLNLVPKNTDLPTLSLQGNTFFYGAQETVSVSNGTWENSPTLFEYQWQKSPYSSSGYNWSNIPNKTSSTLLLDEDEWDSLQTLKYVGYVVRCKVTATNSAGKNSPDVYTLPSPIIGPASQTDINVNVVSNGIVELTWQKVRGATDYYIQYQGPGVAFTEVMSIVNNTDATKGVYTSTGNTIKFTIDTGSASGTLGILVNPTNTSNVSGQTITGYGKNASVSDLKPNKPSVTTNMTSKSSGGTFSWSLNLIQPTSWTIYNNGELYTSSYFTGNPSQTSYEIDRVGEGGSTYGSFTITVNGTVPRFTETSWSSSPALSITYPQVPQPVNQVAPTISGNGRVFTTTNGTWSNESSIYMYIQEWYANGTSIWWATGSTLDLGTNTDYDGMQITSSVQVLTTDLQVKPKVYSSNSITATASTFTIPNLIGVQNPSSTSQYNIAQGSRVTTSSVSEDGKVQSQSPVAGTVVSASPIPTITVNRYEYKAMEWFCTESYQGGGIGNCGYTKPGYNNSASGSGYSRNCVLGYDYPACQSTGPATPPAATPPAATPPAATPPASLPSCPGTITNATSYTCAELGRTYLGGPSNYAIGTGQQCCGDVISTPPAATPPAATPPASTTWYCTESYPGGGVGNCGYSTSSFNNSASGSGYSRNCSTSGYPSCQSTGPATPPAATPPAATPPVATPPVATPPAATPPAATPPAATPPAATPPAATPPAATPPYKYKCLSPEADVFTNAGWVKAKDIRVGNTVSTINKDYIDIESITLNKTSKSLPSQIDFVDSEVVSVEIKQSTLIGFNDLGMNYSVTQPVFIKTSEGIEYRNAGDININDVLVSVNENGLVSEITVESIQIDDKLSPVYDIRTSPERWFIVNSLVAIA